MSEPRYVMGIDPDQKGSVTVLELGPFDSHVKLKMLCAFQSCPTWQRHIYEYIKVYQPRRIYLENVHAFRGQGVTSTFTFGKVAGMAEAPMLILDVPYTVVEPQRWQRRVGVPKRSEIHDPAKRRAQHKKDYVVMSDALFKGLMLWEEDVHSGVLIAYSAALDELEGK